MNKFAILVAAAGGIIAHAQVIIPPCARLCATIAGCRGSYCKSNDLCFGLYRRSDGSLCDQQSDKTCPESDPVNCPLVPTTVDPPTTATSTLSTYTVTTSSNPSIPSEWLGYCDILCEFTPQCLERAKGSYCKTWNAENPVCFGLFWTSPAKSTTCIPGPDCPETIPVLCSEVGQIVPATLLPNV